MNNIFLEILIPTYNRHEQLQKNLLDLCTFIKNNFLNEQVSIFVADNDSDVDLRKTISNLRDDFGVLIKYDKHSQNIGLESNAVYLLEKSTAKYVMYLGDDDFISANYLNEVISLLKEDAYTCVIPSFLAKTVSGETVGSRGIGRRELLKKGINSACKVVLLGHQLSGLVFLRKGTLDEYLYDPCNRNIYPFISFVGINSLRGDTLVLSEYPVYVTVGELKHWNYGADALFAEKIKNVKAITGNKWWQIRMQKIFFIKNVYSILAIYDKNFDRCKAMLLACTNKNISILVKIQIPFILLMFVIKKTSNIFLSNYEPVK